MPPLTHRIPSLPPSAGAGEQSAASLSQACPFPQHPCQAWTLASLASSWQDAQKDSCCRPAWPVGIRGGMQETIIRPLAQRLPPLLPASVHIHSFGFYDTRGFSAQKARGVSQAFTAGAQVSMETGGRFRFPAERPPPLPCPLLERALKASP